MTFTTGRLALRRLRESDLSALRAIMTDSITMAAYEGAFDETGVQAWLDAQLQRYDEDGFGLLAVLRGDDLIGQVGITRQRIEDDEVHEVGYLFRRDRWQRGYATEAASACRDWAFETLGAEAMWAKVRSTNVASMNVAIRLGMRVRRTFVTHYRGVDMPHLGFAISRADGLPRSR